jgi:hypothetical protein
VLTDKGIMVGLRHIALMYSIALIMKFLGVLYISLFLLIHASSPLAVSEAGFSLRAC